MESGLHLYAEKRNEKEKWISADVWSYAIDKEKTRKIWYVNYDNSLVPSASERACELFHDVLAPLRGLPKEANFKIKNCFESWGSDAQDPSWILASEFVNFDWNREVQNIGFLSLSTYGGLLYGITPFDSFDPEYSEGAVLIDEKKMIELISSIGAKSIEEFYDKSRDLSDKYYCKTSWMESYDHYHQWHEWFVKDLMKIGDPKNVRLVYWFDNLKGNRK
jgi:hypothetical protein